MSTLYSAELQPLANPGNSLIDAPKEKNAYRRIDFFSRNTTDAVNGNIANGDTVVLAKLPKGAVILGGALLQGGLGSGVTASVTLGSQNLVTAASSVAAAGALALAGTIALGYGQELAADTDLVLTIGGGTPTGAVAIAGHIDYVWN